MGTTKGGKNTKGKNGLKQGQPKKAGSSSLGEVERPEKKKPVKRLGKRRLTEDEHEAWRLNTKRKMKKDTKATVRKELPEVLVSVLEEAHDGSCQHAKFLLEFAGPDTLPDTKEEKKNRSLVALLAERLKLNENAHD
jgi:hypothetical protein